MIVLVISGQPGSLAPQEQQQQGRIAFDRVPQVRSRRVQGFVCTSFETGTHKNAKTLKYSIEGFSFSPSPTKLWGAFKAVTNTIVPSLLSLIWWSAFLVVQFGYCTLLIHYYTIQAEYYMVHGVQGMYVYTCPLYLLFGFVARLRLRVCLFVCGNEHMKAYKCPA